MNVQNFKMTKALILGLPLRNLGKKCHLDVAFVENHIVYHKEGVVFPPKGCGSCKACKLKLSILSPVHHLRSTCNNYLFSLVVWVDFILNFCLLIHLNPISKLQHAPLPQKCCKLKNVL
jgi:hypothetical protein